MENLPRRLSWWVIQKQEGIFMPATTHIGVTDGAKNKAADLLAQVLADQYVLYTKTRKYHWNVAGHNFAALHEFFEDQYEILDEMIDATAEFLRWYGLPAPGTLAEFAAQTRLKEAPGENPDATQMLSVLLHDHETVISGLRTAIEVASDELKLADLADYFTQIIQKHEKMAWMLRAHLS